MINIEYENEILTFLKQNLDNNRYNHSVSVAITAANIATFYGFNFIDYKISGLLHDIAKKYSTDELFDLAKKYNIELSDDDIKCYQVLHSYVGAYIAKDKFNINEDVFNAIYTHTVGDYNMSNLQKIIYISDYCEPFRHKIENHNYFLKLAYNNINKCIAEITKSTIDYLTINNKYIHKKTFDIYNYYNNLEN